MLKCKPVPSISSKSLLQPEQFLLLVVAIACLAGSYLAGCLLLLFFFSFVVQIQRRESSEVKDVGGARGFSKQLSTDSPRVYFDSNS